MFKNYKRKKKIKKRKELLKSAAIGGVITGAAVSLLTPKSGKELRKDIADTAVEGKNKTCEMIDKCHNFIKEKSKEVKEEVKEKAEKVKNKAEKVKNKADKAKDKTADKLEEVAEELKEDK